MFQELLGKIALGWIRHAVMGLGVWLVHSGLLTSSQSDQATGALMILVPLAFSALDKFEALQARNNAILKAAEAQQASPTTQKVN